MMKSRALSNRGIARAALIVLAGFLASGALGFLRTLVISGQFGTSAALDSFLAAQRIPEIIFVLVAGGALGSSFIPIYARVREGDEDEAWRLASAVMTLAALAALVLAVLVAILAPLLVRTVLLPQSPPEVQAITADMTRMMMITPVIFAVSGLVMGILQSHGLFLLPSVAISMNNIGIMIGALLIAPNLTAHPGPAQIGDSNVYGLAYGAILSALLHLLVQIPGLLQVRARLRLSVNWRIAGVMDVLRLMGPRVLGLAVVQINFLVNIILTDGMVEGSLAALSIAYTLMFFALGVIGQSVGSAVFPTLAAMSAEGDMDGFKDRLSNAMRSVLFLSIPATVIFIMAGEPLVRIFERGEWTAQSTSATAWALAFYATGIAGFALLEVLSRAFYALADTWTPVIIGLGAMIANIVLSLIFVQFIGDPGSLARGPFAGLALANATTTLVEALVLWVLMRRRVGAQGSISGLNDGHVLDGVWRVSGAAAIMGLVIAIIMPGTTRSLSPLLALTALLVAGGISFLLMALILRIQEVQGPVRLVLRRLRR